MYRLRQITLDDKISEQVSIGVLSTVYPMEIVQQCLDEQAAEEPAKTRRVREFVPISIVWFVLVMTLWTRLSQPRVWVHYRPCWRKV